MTDTRRSGFLTGEEFEMDWNNGIRGTETTIHVCRADEWTILKGIMEGDLPVEATIRRCCWKTICEVRGRNFSLVDPEMWREICRRRGYAFH